jgi:aldehyde dehydrogenase (NAD+)
MVTAITTEMGAPHDLSSRSQAACGPGHIKATIEAALALDWEERSGSAANVVREPVGVCALITPWNWPINQLAAKIAPALAAGCTVVLKPSEQSPLSAQLFAEFIDEAGYPAGVFNMVHGSGPTVGHALSVHPEVDMVSFTGSTRAGISVAKGAADTVKRVSQELGGKSANLVFADSDLEAAVKRGVLHCFNNSGQSCNAPTRMIVEDSVYDRVVEIAAKVAAKVTVGDPAKPGNQLGPVVSKLQFDKIQKLIETGVAEGARVVAGGPGKPQGFETGYFVRPTIFADVNNQMTVAREEIFGPVLCILRFRTLDEAIAIANDTPYGLAAYVQTGDQAKARAIARQLRAGSVYLNGAGQDYETPFGGFKQSGNGREWGKHGLTEYLELKAINGFYAA